MPTPIAPHAFRPASRNFVVRTAGGRVAALAAAALLGVLAADTGRGDEPPKPAAETPAAQAQPSPPAKPPFATVMKDAVRIDGLVPLWRKDGKVFAELTGGLLDKEFFVLVAIARGIGERAVLGGMSLSSGDDWVWVFRKVDDSIHVVRKNVRFFADRGSPEQRAVDLAYTDSVLFSLPIVTTGPGGGHVIDLGRKIGRAHV